MNRSDDLRVRLVVANSGIERGWSRGFIDSNLSCAISVSLFLRFCFLATFDTFWRLQISSVPSTVQLTALTY